MILYPLQEMALISYSGVRQLQFECVLSILQECAPQLGAAWPVILRIIGSATNQQKYILVFVVQYFFNIKKEKYN